MQNQKVHVMKKLYITLSGLLILGFAHGLGNPTQSNKASVISTTSTSNSQSAYHYYFRGETLKNALNKFANINGLQVRYNAGSRMLKKAVSGRITVRSNMDVLDQLANQYGFVWFIYSGTLYINSNQQIVKTIYVAPENMYSVKSVLDQSGLLNPKFGYSELPAENKLVVTGPETYVDLITRQIQDFKISPTAQQYAVYRLKYANATDTQLSFNNQTITIPGVATILQGLLQNTTSSSSGNSVSSDALDGRVNEEVKNASYKLNSTNAKVNNNTSSAKVTNNAIIQADNRLNTIIIRDKKANLDIYRNLIQLLDVPAPLIQVEVLIIHLDQDKLNEEGINWWATTKSGFQGGFGASNLSAKPGSDLSAYYGQINPAQLLVNNANTFMASLDFLQKKRFAKAVGKPSLATIDNLPAIVNVTENIYLNSVANQQPNNNNSNSSGSGGTTSNYNQMSLTTSLQITPHIIYDDFAKINLIKLSIVLQDGSISDPTSNVLSNTVQSNITSQAVLKEGQSILLAGYSKDTSEVINKQVPYLGSIPLLGWFFKSSSTQQKKIETVYLVTPKIIWNYDMYKLKDFVSVGGEKFNVGNGKFVNGVLPNTTSTADKSTADKSTADKSTEDKSTADKSTEDKDNQ